MPRIPTLVPATSFQCTRQTECERPLRVEGGSHRDSLRAEESYPAGRHPPKVPRRPVLTDQNYSVASMYWVPALRCVPHTRTREPAVLSCDHRPFLSVAVRRPCPGTGAGNARIGGGNPIRRRFRHQRGRKQPMREGFQPAAIRFSMMLPQPAGSKSGSNSRSNDCSGSDQISPTTENRSELLDSFRRGGT